MLLKQKRPKGFVIGRIATLLMVLAAFAATNSAKAVALGSGGGVDKSRSAEVSDDDAFSGIVDIGRYDIPLQPSIGQDNPQSIGSYGITAREKITRPDSKQQIVEVIYKAFNLKNKEVKIGNNKELNSMLDFLRTVFDAIQWHDSYTALDFQQLYNEVQKQGGKIVIGLDMNGLICSTDRTDIFNIKAVWLDVGLQLAEWKGGSRFIPLNIHMFDNNVKPDMYDILRRNYNIYDLSPRPFNYYIIVIDKNGNIQRIVKLDMVYLLHNENSQGLFALQQKGIDEIDPNDPQFQAIEHIIDSVNIDS